MVHCNEEPTETSVWGAQLDVSLECDGSNNDYNDCSVGYIPLTGLECLKRENSKLSSNHGPRS